jgi:hypothetical protein
MELALKFQELTGKDAVSYSSLKEAYKDIMLFELYVKGMLRKESTSLSFGTLYDDVLFSGDEISKKYFVFDDTEIIAQIGGASPRSTKAYKEWKAQVEFDAQHQQIVSLEDFTMAYQMAERMHLSGVYDLYLKGENQKKILGFINELPVKAILDNLGAGFVSDLKTSSNIAAFGRDIKVWDYDLQAYIYTELTGNTDFFWVVQETKYPYSIRVIKASEYSLQSGRMKFQMAYANVERYINEGNAMKFYEFTEI